LSVHRRESSGLIASVVRVAARFATKDNAMEDRMRGFARVALLACMSALTSAALAFDNGQYDNVPADIRAWFKSVMALNGVPSGESGEKIMRRRDLPGSRRPIRRLCV
jgi:hypothetical protein